MYKQFYNVLTPDEHIECLETLESPGWEFSGMSNDYDLTFWYKELMHVEFFRKTFYNRILELTGERLEIQRLYANGQTYGLPGSLHQDDPSDDSYTFLYYANPHWEIQWGGQTVFYKNEIEQCAVEYTPNSAILFKGNIPHAGLEPTRHYKGLRMTVAFKLLKVND